MRDKKHQFLIFGHVDNIMNICDTEKGMFTALMNMQQLFGIEDKEIEIYFEHGSPDEDRNKTKLFDYETYVKSCLDEYNKQYELHVITPDDYRKFEVVLDEITQMQVNGNAIKLIFNKEHEPAVNLRRDVVYDVQTHIYIPDYKGDRSEKNSIFEKLIYEQEIVGFDVLPKEIYENEYLRYNKVIFDTCKYGKYIIKIREYIKQRLNSGDRRVYDTKVDYLFNDKDYAFPPMNIYNGGIYDVNKENVNAGINTIPNKIVEYLTHTKTIIDNINPEDIKLMLDKSVLELSMRAIFETTYNGISVNNNYFYNFVINKVNDDRVKNAIDRAINNIELKQQIQQNQPQPRQLLVHNAGITPKQTTINKAKKNITDLQKDKEETKDRVDNGQQIRQP